MMTVIDAKAADAKPSARPVAEMGMVHIVVVDKPDFGLEDPVDKSA
jgi:hypothetical protein